MRDFPCLRLARDLPPVDEIVDRVRARAKPDAAEVLRAAKAAGRVAIQPRCGVGALPAMAALLKTLEAAAAPDMLTLTIDSHTRLGAFDRAAAVLAESPGRLNGFPLVAHGWRAGAALDAMIAAPLQVRHGSPDGRRLFAEALAAGLTSFEGGPIGYNIPYCRDVPLSESLAAWGEIEEAVGALAAMGVTVEREFFGSLTGVAVPPSIALACVTLEAMLALRAGARVLSLSVPQGGCMAQDVAALACVPALAAEFLPGAEVHAILHQFMGVFPAGRDAADALIFAGGVAARLGGASKVITKTWAEAHGVPTAWANAAGLNLTRAAVSGRIPYPAPDAGEVAAETAQILAEARELIGPLAAEPDLSAAVVAAFRDGRLDVPFPASRAARGRVMPVRDAKGAIRFGALGALPFSDATARVSRECAAAILRERPLSAAVRDGLMIFAEEARR